MAKYLLLPLVWLWELTATPRDRLDLVAVSVRLALLDRELESIPRGDVRDAAVSLRLALCRHRLAIRRTIAGRQARWQPTATSGLCSRTHTTH